jgi:tetratricopeptide (TPR) repeat protein
LLYHKQFEMVVEEAKKLREATNSHHMSLHYWALTHFLTGQYQKVDALQTKASLLVAERNMVRGGKIIRKVLKLKPNSGRMLALQGEVEFFSLEIPPAIKSFEKTLTLMPDHIGSLHFLGWCYAMAGEFDVSAMTFKKALALDANFAESQGALAVIAVLQNDLVSAAELAAKVLDKTPECASANYALELIAEQSDDGSEAAPATAAAQGFGQRIIAVVKQFKQ